MTVYLVVAAIVCNGCNFKIERRFETVAACNAYAELNVTAGAYACLVRGDQLLPSRFRPAARR